MSMNDLLAAYGLPLDAVQAAASSSSNVDTPQMSSTGRSMRKRRQTFDTDQAHTLQISNSGDNVNLQH